MLRRLARLLLVLMAVASLVPGFDEVVEQVGELVQHGHAAHTVPGEQDPLAGEHGCTPIEHHCRCHDGQSVALASLRGAWGGASPWLTWMLDAGHRPRSTAARFRRMVDEPLLSRATSPPTPPPNA